VDELRKGKGKGMGASGGREREEWKEEAPKNVVSQFSYPGINSTENTNSDICNSWYNKCTGLPVFG
jgi:hypothetical protein